MEGVTVHVYILQWLLKCDSQIFDQKEKTSWLFFVYYNVGKEASFFLFWLPRMAWEILVPQPGIEACSFNHWTLAQ